MPKYTLTKRIVALGADYDVTREDGTLAYCIDGKIRFAYRIAIRDAAGNVLLDVKETLLALKNGAQFFRDGQLIATMTKEFYNVELTSADHKYVVDVVGGETLTARGYFIEDDWRLKRGDEVIAQLRERPRTVVRETYDAEIADDADTPLVLGIMAAILKEEPNTGSEA